MLAERLVDFWKVNADVQPMRVASSVHKTNEARAEQVRESKVFDASELMHLGIEFVEV